MLAATLVFPAAYSPSPFASLAPARPRTAAAPAMSELSLAATVVRDVSALPTMYALMSLNEYMTHRYFQHLEFNRPESLPWVKSLVERVAGVPCEILAGEVQEGVALVPPLPGVGEVEEVVASLGAPHAPVDLVHETLNSKVETLDIDAMDITPEKVGKFDVVMFLGVLYHLQDPMAGLRVAADVCDELLIIETQMDDLQRWKPSMVYYPGDSFNNDDTNYWAPNVAAMKGMLKDLGFSRVEVVYPKRPWLRYAWPIRYLSSIKGVFEGRGSFRQTMNQGRMSFHAYR